MRPLSAIHVVSIAIAYAIAFSAPTIANDEVAPRSESDFVNQIAARLKPLQQNGWLEWKPGTEMVRAFLPADPKQFTSYVQADQIYTIGGKNGPLTRAQAGGLLKLNPGRPDDGPIPVAYMYRPNGGEEAQLTLDGNEIKCRIFRQTIRIDLAGGHLVESVRKEWIIPSHPTICMRWEAGKNYGVIKSIRATRTVGGKKYSCVVLEKRMALPNDGFSLEIVYLSPEVPGFVVERTQDIYKSTEDKKPLRIRERVKRVSFPQ
jgi:hypothetical protein